MTQQAQPKGKKQRFQALTISRDFTILLVSLVVVALGFGILSPIMPIFAQKVLGLDIAETGANYSMYAVSFTVFMLPAGYLADRLGRKPLILVGIVTFGATTLALLYISESWQFGLLRFVEGIGAALLTPAAFALTVDIVPESKRGLAMGAEATAELLGVLGGPGLGGILYDLFGFEAPFVGAAVLSFVCAALLTRIRDPGVRTAEANPSFLTIFQAWRRNARENRALMAVTTRGFVMGIVQGLWNLGLLWYWMDKFEMSPGELGAAISLEVLVMMLGSIPFGSMSDKVGRRPFILGGGALMVSGLFFNVLITDVWQVYVFVAVSAFGAAMSNPSVGGMLADVMSKEERGRVMGAYQFIGGIGIFVGYTLLGYMYAAISPEAPIIMCSIALAAATLIIAVFVNETHKPLAAEASSAAEEKRI
ncbi:MAG: MFS transporter [Thermoplasmata archaeon]|jgi:MFS family permease|nr:MFS transporter [Thermoplasmata archaeon]